MPQQFFPLGKMPRYPQDERLAIPKCTSARSGEQYKSAYAGNPHSIYTRPDQLVPLCQHVVREHSVMLSANTVLCCPRTQCYVVREHGVMLPANTVLCFPRTQFLCCPRTQCYVARGDIWNKKASFNSFPSKTNMERRSNTTRFLANYERQLNMHVHVCILPFVYRISCRPLAGQILPDAHTTRKVEQIWCRLHSICGR
jgi:hypothetical protein